MSKGYIDKVGSGGLDEFIAEHRPHFEPKDGAMECSRATDTSDLWVCRCSCSQFWVGKHKGAGEVFGMIPWGSRT